MAELKLTKPGDEGEALKKTCVEKMLFFLLLFLVPKDWRPLFVANVERSSRPLTTAAFCYMHLSGSGEMRSLVVWPSGFGTKVGEYGIDTMGLAASFS